MTMPKIYMADSDDRDVAAPMPLLKISHDMCIIAVDADGNDLATIVDTKAGAIASAKGAIEAGGHDTSWAVWDERGRFKRLAEFGYDARRPSQTCAACGRDNGGYGGVCTSDDCPANAIKQVVIHVENGMASVAYASDNVDVTIKDIDANKRRDYLQHWARRCDGALPQNNQGDVHEKRR